MLINRTKRYVLWAVATPIIGLAIGLTAGVAGVGAARLFGLGLSALQEKIALVGFTGVFFVFGLIDAAVKLSKYFASKREQIKKK